VVSCRNCKNLEAVQRRVKFAVMRDLFKEKVFQYVTSIPKGKVTSYGDIARAVGRPGAARAVGSILKRNPRPFDPSGSNRKAIPCHRVVRADRLIGGYNGPVGTKENLLKKEGVKIINGRVDTEHILNK